MFGLSTIPLSTWIFLGGLAHFGILIASFSAPRMLDWKHALAPLKSFNRQVIWTHGMYLAFVIASFGLVSVLAPHLLADGSPLARVVCGFIATFWGGRLFLQWFVYDPREYVVTTPLRLGYHGLTVVFVFVTAVYGWAALAGTAPISPPLAG
jgi:hypothetical protein